MDYDVFSLYIYKEYIKENIMKQKLFCPNPKCDFHSLNNENNNWYIKIGFYSTNTFGEVQRYKCKHCNKKFSEQTFNLDYYAKKKIDYYLLLCQLTTKSGLRDMSRFMELSLGTISNRISRLSRQALALQSSLLDKLSVTEDLAADGFESFCVSQYFPDNLNILVGKESQFVYFSDYVTLRRKGRMTSFQKKKRGKLEKIFKADSNGIERSFITLLDKLNTLFIKSDKAEITLYTDKKSDYIRAIKKNKDIKNLKDNGEFKHVRTSSKIIRNTSNPLFPVNYIDREIRKGLANHVRETVQFSRNVNDNLSRLQLFFAHHNYWKDFRIKENITSKHGEVAGIPIKDIDYKKSTFFIKRAFYTHYNISGVMKKMWFRKFVTPLKENEEYVPNYAYA